MQESQSAARNAVLELLKREGPISADALAEKLGVTGMAVRLHLQALYASEMADFTSAPRPRGRPAQMWRVTPKADEHFADTHSTLAVELIGRMKKAFGEEGMDKVLKLRTADQEKAYRAELDRIASLKIKLDRLAKIRTSEGYMAEVRVDAATGDLLFVENHCPICAAARLCTGLCREELALFQRVLGKDVKVERVSHILAGAGRCAYRVTA
ncbi:MAG TPA: metalloregulator ArsR/SmtB family transcription factor [Rhizomicrobium sp.]|nr:metalloregulator ArsR/SmtB family transcription factor [Rhizomicrobium sp.]